MFYTDKPILSLKDDSLNRGSFAKLLARSILNLNSNDTFTIGLFGEWGSGKTSLLNIMLKEIEAQQANTDENEKLIVIHFEPWNFSSDEQLLSQFFIHLTNELNSKANKALAKVAEGMVKYTDALATAFKSLESVPKVGKLSAFLGEKGIPWLTKILKGKTERKDILKQKEYVTKLLEEQPNRILIVIDDMDRLSSQQIRQVFQLITAVAKFPKTMYLLAFDKKIVVEALKDVQKGSGEAYLEKVIQMPIEVPAIQGKDLRKILFNHLEDILSACPDVQFLDSDWQALFQQCIAPFLQNLRDVNRLCNSIQFKLAALAAEVDFVDTVAISVIEIFMPPVYEWVKGNKSLLLGQVDFLDFSNKKYSPTEWRDLYKSELVSLLSQDAFVVSKEKMEEIIITLLSHLFPVFGNKVGRNYEVRTMNELRKNNRIGHPDKFDRYFHLSLDNIAFTKSQIEHMLQRAEKEELKAFLMKQDGTESAYDFLEEVYARLTILPIDRVLCIIGALVEVASSFKSASFRKFWSSDTSRLAYILTLDLIERIEPDKRLQCICDILETANLTTLEALANIINIIELCYGRLAANGEERGDKRVITIEELLSLEEQFSNRTKFLLDSEKSYLFDGHSMILYLLEHFAPDYVSAYLSKYFENDTKVLNFLLHTINVLTGDGVLYEVKKDYQKYMTNERVLNAINSQKKIGDFFALPERTQIYSAVFCLHAMCKSDNFGYIHQEDVDDLLNEWKNEALDKVFINI